MTPAPMTPTRRIGFVMQELSGLMAAALISRMRPAGKCLVKEKFAGQSEGQSEGEGDSEGGGNSEGEDAEPRLGSASRSAISASR
jgi:hypothetical protein